jgi:F1F0 ATPase subunit 2
MNIDGIWGLVAITTGMTLGWSYFGGLWLTIQRLPTVTCPMALVLGSFLLRIGITVMGFYLVMGGHWARLLLGLLGFLFMRAILVHRWGNRGFKLARVNR